MVSSVGRSGCAATGRTGPGIGVKAESWVDEIGLVICSPPASRDVRVDLVDTALNSSNSTAVGFVPHGIGEGLYGCGTRKGVAVVVDEPVKIRKGKATVYPQNRSTRCPQAAPGQLDGVRKRRGEWRMLGVGRLAALTAGPSGPERFASLVDAVEQLDSSVAERGKLAVDLRQLGAQAVALHVESDTVLARHSLDSAKRLTTTEALPVAWGPG